MAINTTSGVKLTAKQEGFAQSVVGGANQSDAYREWYSVANSVPERIHVQSSLVASNPKVAQRIAELRAAVTTEIVKVEAWTQTRFLREAETNMDMAREAHQLAPANGALTLIGKVTGIVTESAPAVDTALDAIIKLAAVMSDAQLRAQAALPAVEGTFEVIPDGDGA